MSHSLLYRDQQGQALAEGLIGLAAIAVLFWAIPVLGRYQDVALQSAHASRYAAFLLTQDQFDDATLSQMIDREYFSHADTRWRTTAGAALLASAPAVTTRRLPVAAAQLHGGGQAQADLLGREWRLGDESIVSASVSGAAKDVFVQGAAGGSVLRLMRNTAVMTGAGHAGDDADAQLRVAQGALAWRGVAGQSAAAGLAVAARLRAVDRAWGRAPPEFDWTSAWPGLVPADRLAQRP